MDQGYKHFSHLHNLIMHQMPEGIDVACSGCHSSATGTVHVCWQCNFFLHDQCYRATRSLKHPSHPPHPLTLFPYPTYQSNSFYCNSCEIIGTGLSYSCADCEFDLHVQCAYSISGATSLNNGNQFQELVPQGWNIGEPNSVSNAQYHSTTHDLAYSQNSNTNALDPFVAHNLASVSYPPNMFPSCQDPSMLHNGPSVSVPTSSQGPSTHQDGPSAPAIPTSSPYPYMDQTGASSSYPTIPTSSQGPSTHQDGPSAPAIPTSSPYPYKDQTGSSFPDPTNPPDQFLSVQGPSMPQNGPPVSIPTSSHNQTSASQYPSVDQSKLSFSDPNPPNLIPSIQGPSTHQTGPSAPIIPMSSKDRITSSQYPDIDQTGASFADPTNPLDQLTSVQGPSMPQNGPSVSISTNYQPHSIPCNEDHSTPQISIPSVSIPTTSHNSIPSNPSRPQTGILNDQETKHFSHPHNLSRVSLQEDEENEVICSGCEDTLVGNGYSCVEQDCNFHLHESCFHLEKEIHHKSHPEHPLTLILLAPDDNKDGGFTCNACFSDGAGFTYRCSICNFNLHIQCVTLPETAKRDDHKHTLKLFYSCPVKDEEYTFSCDVCHGEIQKDRWVYYCEACDYGTHLGCVDCEECETDSILDAQAHLQRLQIRMEMARQQSEFMATLAARMSNSYV